MAAMMMHPTVSTSSSRELLLELKRHNGHGGQQSTMLPPYNLKLVRESLQDIQWHLKEAEMEIQAATAATTDTDEPQPDRFAPKPSILLHDNIVRRHKRCLLAYHVHRAHALQRQVLESTTTGPTTTSTTGTTTTTSTGAFSHLTQNAPELDFCQSYHQLRRNYWQRALPDLAPTGGAAGPSGITPNLAPPSATGNVQVRCLIDQGPVVLDSGRSITLTKGSVLYVPKSDVWEWLQNGTLQVLEGEEVDF
jgi:hypothetical protein